MTAPKGWSLWRGDEVMVKKDDDVVLPGHRRHSVSWSAARPRRRTRIKRATVYVLTVGALLFFLFHRRSFFWSDTIATVGHEPTHDALGKAHMDGSRPPENTREESTHPRRRPPLKVELGAESGPAPIGEKGEPDQKPLGETDRTKSGKARYDGPIKFPRLSASLRDAASAGGTKSRNRNVLFVTASLKSASALLPIACEMAAQRHSNVHFAFIGAATITMRELLRVNGVDDACKIELHDARPDHFDVSSEYRMSLATTEALRLFKAYLHPQAVIVDSSGAEEDYFLRPARRHVPNIPSALVELPGSASDGLSWITKLDSAALSAWDKVQLDVLIYAPPTGSANLQRLLRSLRKADLTGVRVPHITIEVPHVVEPALESLLAKFEWPPPSSRVGQQPQMISLRRRISRERLGEEDSSLRFVESFWPTNPLSCHVLVLSPHTEITPQFFQCASPTDVKYALLRQLHSHSADFDETLMGISLSVPATLIDGISAFSPPTRGAGGEGKSSGQTAFLWQRPSSEAMVFMGSKWIELHHFVSRMLPRKRALSGRFAKQEGGKMYPAWLEYALQLSRLRGYTTLYPSQETAMAIVGVHNDIQDVPEEYRSDVSKKGSPKDFIDEGNEAFDPASPVNMLETLPGKGELQTVSDNLPLLSWDGKTKSASELATEASEYTASFRREVGGCEDKHPKAGARIDAVDLFCTDSNA